MIEDLKIAPDEDKPRVYLSKGKNVFEMVGRSMPENVNKLFLPILSWFTDYFADPLTNTTIKLDLEYFNSASAKKIVELFILIEKEVIKGIDIKIIWMYKKHDLTLQKKGKELLTSFNIPFELIAV